jgi:hypothetical protein
LKNDKRKKSRKKEKSAKKKMQNKFRKMKIPRQEGQGLQLRVGQVWVLRWAVLRYRTREGRVPLWMGNLKFENENGLENAIQFRAGYIILK